MLFRFCLTVVVFLFFSAISLSFAKTNKLVGTKLTFENHQITAPFTVNLPVIALDIITNEQFPADEIVLIGQDEQNKLWLAVYVFDEKENQFSLFDKLLLDEKYFAFDVSENNQGLYFLAKNEVVTLNYKSVKHEGNSLREQLFLEHRQSVNSIFLLDESNFIAQQNFIEDINKDGLDDIVLPDFEGINLWLATKSTQDYFFQSLPIKAKADLMRGGIHFKPTAIYYGDFNADHRQDLAWVSKGSINYYSQNDGGSFLPESKSLALANSIDGLDWWQIREADGESPDQSNLIHRVVEQIKDINGDGLVDVIVRFTQSSGVLDRVNDYEFYLGYLNESGQLAYLETASTVIQAEGTSTGLKIVDINSDEKFEVLLSSFELSVGNIIGALMSGGIDQNVLLYTLNEQGVFEDDPKIEKEVELSFSLSSGQSGQPIVMLADVNGDDLQDLVLSSGDSKLKIYLGQNSSRLFNRKASKHKLMRPKNGDLFKHHDINGDGKEDFIMSYGRLDEQSMANKVTILMVK